MPLFAELDFDPLPWVWAALSIGLIAWRWPRLRGTTLIAPTIWSVAAIACLAVANAALYSGSDSSSVSWRPPLQYFAGVTSLCPAMALFGAKRPQNGAWQFIVLSLWIVLCLPSLHWWAVGDDAFGVHSAQSWFLLILLLMTGSNYCATRFAVSSLLVTVAQFLLLGEFLPISLPIPRLAQHSVAFCTLAIILIALDWPRKRVARFSLDRVWLDFRDAFGAVWALRVQQRLNQSATMYGWNVRLDWRGFVPVEGTAISPEIQKSLQDNLSNLLRRFVSPQWIAERRRDPRRTTNIELDQPSDAIHSP
jgi:hypothetical protein